MFFSSFFSSNFFCKFATFVKSSETNSNAFRTKRDKWKTFWGLLAGSQGHTLSVTVLVFATSAQQRRPAHFRQSDSFMANDLEPRAHLNPALDVDFTNTLISELETLNHEPWTRNSARVGTTRGSDRGSMSRVTPRSSYRKRVSI